MLLASCFLGLSMKKCQFLSIPMPNYLMFSLVNHMWPHQQNFQHQSAHLGLVNWGAVYHKVSYILNLSTSHKVTQNKHHDISFISFPWTNMSCWEVNYHRNHLIKLCWGQSSYESSWYVSSTRLSKEDIGQKPISCIQVMHVWSSQHFGSSKNKLNTLMPSRNCKPDGK